MVNEIVIAQLGNIVSIYLSIVAVYLVSQSSNLS
jgi:hypothetical protein